MTITELIEENKKVKKEIEILKEQQNEYGCQNCSDKALMLIRGRWKEKRFKLQQENKQLKEALKKVNPIEIIAFMDIEGQCKFCKGSLIEKSMFGEFELILQHTDNCEYVKLTKESEDK